MGEGVPTVPLVQQAQGGLLLQGCCLGPWGLSHSPLHPLALATERWEGLGEADLHSQAWPKVREMQETRKEGGAGGWEQGRAAPDTPALPVGPVMVRRAMEPEVKDPVMCSSRLCASSTHLRP